MNDWKFKLASGAVSCKIFHQDQLIKELIPMKVEELWVSIEIPMLGERARGDFSYEYIEFVESNEKLARYSCEACKTIVKFGKPMQFKETFIVAFELYQ